MNQEGTMRVVNFVAACSFPVVWMKVDNGQILQGNPGNYYCLIIGGLRSKQLTLL